MKFFLFIISLSVVQPAYSQIARDTTVTRDSLLNYLNGLINENTVQAKEMLKKEADALKRSPAEADMLLALTLYRTLNDEVTSTTLEKNILKKFPKGTLSRDLSYDKVFGNAELSLEEKEKGYIQWLKKYPRASYAVEQQGKFDFALLGLIQAFSKAGNIEKVNHYLGALKEPNLRTTALFYVGKDFLDREEPVQSMRYLEEALALSKQAKESTDIKVRNGFAALFYDNLINLYSQALLLDGQVTASIALISGPLEEMGYEGVNSEAMTLTLAKGLIQSGMKLNAFIALDKYLQKNPLSPEIIALSKPLYMQLNDNKGDFQDYVQALQTAKRKEQMDHLKSVMIREKAPLFELYNRKGELVRLADFKGKVVVLDFWATWCKPCIASFPGMQAAIDKYRDNKDVEFLFINTWETKANFKESVNELMEQNQYSFNVLFDQQNDENDELVVKQYGVEGIPTKFIIDKNGDIRFKASSSRTDKESVLDEISMMIDIILEE